MINVFFISKLYLGTNEPFCLYTLLVSSCFHRLLLGGASSKTSPRYANESCPYTANESTLTLNG